MRIRLVALSLGALGTFAFAACSSSQPDPYAQVSEYCAGYAQAICQIGTTSCQFDVKACQTYQTNLCTANVPTGGRQYTSANVKPCLDAVNAAYGGGPSTIPAATLNSIAQVCAQVFVGTAGKGQACQLNTDCAVSGEICATAPNQTPKCAVATQRQLGDQCLDTGDQCPSNAYCSTQGTCVSAQTNGQPCSSTSPCDGADHCVSAVCQALASTGQTCASSADCASSLFCDLYTDSVVTTPACVSALTFARGGVDCLGIAGQATSGSSSGGSGSSSGGSGSGSGGGSGSSSGGGSGSGSGSSSGGDAGGDASGD